MTYSSKELGANKSVEPLLLTLRALRRRYKLRQVEFASMIGIDECTLNKLETGKLQVSTRMRARLQEFCVRWKPYCASQEKSRNRDLDTADCDCRVWHSRNCKQKAV